MEEDAEAMAARHRREAKELQGKVTGLRKGVPKGDKKRKKEVTAEIEELEAQLRARHEAELAQLVCGGETGGTPR